MGIYWKEKQLAWRDMVWVVMIQSYKKGTYIHSTDFQMGDELHVIILHQKVYLKIQYLNVKRDRVYTWKPFIRNLQCSILFISIRINSKTKQNNKKTAHMHWKAWTSMHYHLPRWCWWWRISLPMRRPRFSPWVGKIPWRREWLPTPVFLAWRIPWTEEPGGLQSVGSKRVGHNYSD